MAFFANQPFSGWLILKRLQLPTSCYYIQIDDAEAKDNRYTRTVRTMWPYARSEHMSDQLVSQSELQRVKIDRDRACGAPKSASGAYKTQRDLPGAEI